MPNLCPDVLDQNPGMVPHYCHFIEAPSVMLMCKQGWKSLMVTNLSRLQESLTPFFLFQ